MRLPWRWHATLHFDQMSQPHLGCDDTSPLLELMVDMVHKFNSSLILVTHNSLLPAMPSALYMYAGRIVEEGTCKEYSRDRATRIQRACRNVPRLMLKEKG